MRVSRREDLERREHERLSSDATFADASLGRRAPEEPDPAVEREEEPAIPATGDASTFFSAVPALAGMSAIAAGAHFRRRR